MEHIRFPQRAIKQNTQMKCLILPKLSSESVTHQLSHTKARSY